MSLLVPAFLLCCTDPSIFLFPTSKVVGIGQAKMVKKERKVNVSGKPKHSLDANRANGGMKDGRSAATVRRLKMYNTRPKRNSKGNILKHEFQSKELPSTRIQPDRRWFGIRLFFVYALILCVLTEPRKEIGNYIQNIHFETLHLLGNIALHFPLLPQNIIGHSDYQNVLHPLSC